MKVIATDTLNSESTIYKDTMENVIEPALLACSQTFPLERNKEEKLHCVRYKADYATGIIVISHGFTESAEKFLEVIYYFLKAHYHVYILDHCGHGKSYRLCKGESKVYVDHYQRYVDDFAYLLQYIKEQHDLPIYLYAHSMGGAIAALTAAKYPELVQKIILSSPMIQPATGNMPWVSLCAAARMACLLGKSKEFIPGHHAYLGLEDFEESCASNKARFDYYNEKKASTKLYQTSGATYGWLKAATKMYDKLINHAVKQIKQPVLLFQAENDNVVSSDAQLAFIEKLKANGNENATLIQVPNAKHEIYNSDDSVLNTYYGDIMKFL